MAHTFTHVVSVAHPDQHGDVEKIGRDDGCAMFDQAARFYLHISGDEFRRRYDRGDYDADLDRSDIQHLITLRRFADQ